MRRQNRKSNNMQDKIILYAGIGVAVLAIVVIALFIYSKNLNDDVKNSTMSLEKMANIANNTQNTQNTESTESTSTEIGKSVEESANELNTTNMTNSTNSTNITNQTTTSNTLNKTNTTNQTISTSNKANDVENQTTQTSIEENKKELNFAKPVEGEVVREYAKDNLIYSNTLAEWTTHLGIDIKAEKTTIVNSAEEGTIKSIKNDPRYGLTIVIEHADGFQTIYSNLLTSEYVVEGEKVEKGQAIGTVGNTGVFEIADEPHLHFEILKDSLQVDPSIYIK